MYSFILRVALLCLLSPGFLYPQTWQEDFSATPFSGYANWWGDREKFRVDAHQRLLLDDPQPGAANTARVFSQHLLDRTGSLVWELELILAFDPSSQNYVTLGLCTDLPEPDIFPEGIYLQIGGQSGEDVLELYQWQAQQKQAILSMAFPRATPSELPLLLQVSYLQGQWHLKVCDSPGACEEITALYPWSAPTHPTFFSLHCRYTPTRNTRIAFDHIRIEGRIPDREPPRLLRVELNDSQLPELLFSEPIQTFSPPPGAWWFPDSTNLLSLICPDKRPNSCQLLPATHLQWDTAYRLIIPMIADGAGNTVRCDTLLQFNRPYEPAAGDLVLTEIMADPDDFRGLPDAEYLELFNRQNHPLSLEGWQLQVNQRLIDLPAHTIPPKSYFLLYPEDATGKFNGLDYPGLTGFPAIPNNGAYLALLYRSRVIDALQYTPQWYRGETQAGVSLEKIAAQLNGSCPQNWAASASITGGSPASANTLSGYTAADSLFYINMVYPLDDCCIEIQLSQQPDDATPLFFRSLPALEMPALEFFPQDQKIWLHLATALSPETTYQLEVPSSWMNCIGAPLLKEEAYPFGKNQSPRPGDIALHEILFDPLTGCPPFVELINNSPHFLDLSGLLLQSYDPNTDTYDYSVLPPNLMLPPDSLLVLSPDPGQLKSYFPATPLYNCIGSLLPRLPKQQGTLALWADQQLLDSIVFDATWHHPFLPVTRGVALEKISPGLPGDVALHWQSGAAKWNYATPGFRPSLRATPHPSPATGSSDILRISPDGDGVDDYLHLPLDPQPHNTLFNAGIYSWDGRLIRQLTSAEPAAASGFLRWNGDDPTGTSVPRGFYLIRITYYHPDGWYVPVKKLCLLW